MHSGDGRTTLVLGEPLGLLCISLGVWRRTCGLLIMLGPWGGCYTNKPRPLGRS